jgi:CheY-like chemotaxis protein
MPARILVLEDSQEIRDLLREVLETEGGYSVTTATYKPHLSGEVKQIRPDLILSDYRFGDEPKGLEVLHELEQDHETAGIPFIICSAALKELQGMEGDLASKGIDILYKPFDIDQLLNIVARKLGEKDTEKV